MGNIPVGNGTAPFQGSGQFAQAGADLNQDLGPDRQTGTQKGNRLFHLLLMLLYIKHPGKYKRTPLSGQGMVTDIITDQINIRGHDLAAALHTSKIRQNRG